MVKAYLPLHFLSIWFSKLLKPSPKTNVNDNTTGGSWDWGDFRVKGNNSRNDSTLRSGGRSILASVYETSSSIKTAFINLTM